MLIVKHVCQLSEVATPAPVSPGDLYPLPLAKATANFPLEKLLDYLARAAYDYRTLTRAGDHEWR